jgi:hypothetical protein
MLHSGMPDGADEIGHGGDALARGVARLVHRAGAGDKKRNATGPQPCDGQGDEVIMQA